jgi:hypothetical protein
MHIVSDLKAGGSGEGVGKSGSGANGEVGVSNGNTGASPVIEPTETPTGASVAVTTMGVGGVDWHAASKEARAKTETARKSLAEDNVIA